MELVENRYQKSNNRKLWKERKGNTWGNGRRRHK